MPALILVALPFHRLVVAFQGFAGVLVFFLDRLAMGVVSGINGTANSVELFGHRASNRTGDDV
jgi:hypothetical protein